MKSFQDRIVVVTGGASGVGKALAKAFLADGAKVVLSDVEVPALEKTCAELGDQGGEVSSVVTDVRDENSVRELADGVYRLDVLPTVTDSPAGNPLDGDGNGTGGDAFVFQGDGTNRFFVLATDWNGSGGVNILDFATFAYWFGLLAPTAPEYVDTNNSGGVNILDFAPFAGNFNTAVTLPPPLAPPSSS